MRVIEYREIKFRTITRALNIKKEGTSYGPLATDIIPLGKFADNCTIVNVTHKTDTGTVDFNLEKRAAGTPATTGTKVWSADKQADSSYTIETSFTSASITADQWLVYVASAVASSPTELWISIEIAINE